MRLRQEEYPVRAIVLLKPCIFAFLEKIDMKRKNPNTGQYPEFDSLSLTEIDNEIASFWARENVFNRSVSTRPSEKPFVFFEGPPSANGKPGIHHVMGRAVKDLFCRYKTLKGYRVERRGGWDTHGLPVELKVESDLGITKEDIGRKITVEEYNQKCKETVMQFKDMWDDLTRKMGYWVDLDNPYITFDNDYIESVWWTLKQVYSKGLIYKGYTIQPFSPAAGTGLSSHELNQPGTYKDVSDTSVTAQFKVVRNQASSFLFDNEEEDVRFIAWTTTPWTLPSNTALGVGPKIEYVKVKTLNAYTKEPVSVVLARDLIPKWFTEEQLSADSTSDSWAKVENSYTGKELVGLSYEQLLPYAKPQDGEAFRVISGDFVTTEDGTGIVHLAPSFGADDRQVAQDAGIGSLTLVDKQGRFTPEAGPFAGRYVKNYRDEADYKSPDIDIAIHLKESNKAFNVQKYRHNYPHCWRTDKPILYYPLDSWFIRSTAVKEKLIANNQKINWKPAHTGEGRFGKWLEDLKDWNLSRSRFWGIPLPIWATDDGAEYKCIGSVSELNEEMQKANEALGVKNEPLNDLHRPYVDDVVLVSNDGRPMKREKDVIDVWFDSGSMPYAQVHYPFENREIIEEEKGFPADFIAEGVDQTRGWFFTLHTIATLLFDKPAYKNVVANGLVLDKNGEKMSKRKGNVVDPFETIKTYGADATRWYMLTNAQPWDNLKFDLAGIDEVRRKFFGTLYNTYSFYALYANIDGFIPGSQSIAIEKRSELDRWIISKLYANRKEVEQRLDDYEPTQAFRMVQQFVIDDLSNWFVRLSRRRFWKGEMNDDKRAGYETLFECMVVVAQMMSPVAPFFADWLYRSLRAAKGAENHPMLQAESVHLCDWYSHKEDVINSDLNKRMDLAQKVSSLVRSIRKGSKIKLRQPLSRVLIPVNNEAEIPNLKLVEGLICSETNVKEVVYLTETAGILTKQAKANFKRLGRRMGPLMKATAQAIAGLGQKEIQEIETSGSITITIEGEPHVFSQEDVEIATVDVPGLQVATEGSLTVALDVEITPELEQEGLARELVNRLQNLRKDKGFDVTDRIAVTLESNDMLGAVINLFSDYIKRELLADTLEFGTAKEDSITIGDNNLKVDIFNLSRGKK